MRELKFRAWDKVNKIYIYVTLGDLICGACTETGDKKLSGNEQIWEQYTGIKDQNDKEIYEGDTVSKHNSDLTGVVKQVKDGQWAIYWDNIPDGYYVLFKYSNLCEVVGNIHENPELLEENKNA